METVIEPSHCWVILKRGGKVTRESCAYCRYARWVYWEGRPEESEIRAIIYFAGKDFECPALDLEATDQMCRCQVSS